MTKLALAAVSTVIVCLIPSSSGETTYVGSRGQPVSGTALNSGLQDLEMLWKFADDDLKKGVINELRVVRNFVMLKPLFEAAEKDSNGGLDARSVREILFKHFAQDSSSETWETLQSDTQENTNGLSFDLHRAAVLATALESQDWMRQAGDDVANAVDELQNLILDTPADGSSESEEQESSKFAATTWCLLLVTSSATAWVVRSLAKKSGPNKSG
eukprot:TRINITY_DN6958_c0_g1_i5.p1 TRINITY_DN6958_c0_g1~~TRINITY_DN6958_c0_g1_i5.p1  ORF type:complete len:215 (-),score=40.45 TRINITY_DN6958_c0_g1_i5:166-810(-)